MKHVRALLDKTWIWEYITGSYGAPTVLAPKSRQEEITNIKDFVWRMCVIYRALNKVTASFEYSISRRDDAIDNLGDDAKTLFFIRIDCAQVYHQIRVWWQDWEKLTYFAPYGKKYTYTVMSSSTLHHFIPLLYACSKLNGCTCFSCTVITTLLKSIRILNTSRFLLNNSRD